MLINQINILGDANMEKKYNGWKNWETWNANLWLNNDEYWQKQLEICKTAEDIELLYDSAIENEYIKDAISRHRIDFHEILENNI